MMQRVLISLIAILFLTCCKNDNLDVDISGVQAPALKLLRLEDDLLAITPSNFDSKSSEIKQRYGNFYEQYLAKFLTRTGTRDSMYKPAVLQFTSDKDIRGCYNQVKKIYTPARMEGILKEANNCVKRFKYHFPGKPLPSKLVTCLTGWNYASAYTDSTLVIGLDMYLGDTSVYYQMLHLPQFRTRFMNEKSILPDMVRGWMITEFDNSDPTNTLLNHTIFYGKIFYCTKALLPHTPDSLLLAYTSPQMKFCEDNEKNLWGFFAEKNRLYENNMKTLHELIDEGPFTGVINKECPPRIAMWMGLQIVRSYMKNNKVSLADLMKENNAQVILNKSKYRP